jgi:hypothetical protein
MRYRIYLFVLAAYVCALSVVVLAVAAATAAQAENARTFLPYPLVLRESRYLAERECEATEGACAGWEVTCQRIARRRIDCELAWFYPWRFDPAMELRCAETLYWGLGREGFLALRGQSGVSCEPTP